MTLDIGVHRYHCAFAGDSLDCRAPAPADKEDGAPRRGERKTQRGDEPLGEKHLEGSARTRPCRVQRAGPEIPEGVLSERLAAASEQLRSQSKQLQSQSEQLAAVSGQLRSASEQLEQKSEELRSVSEQKAGRVYRRMHLVLLNSHIFGGNLLRL